MLFHAKTLETPSFHLPFVTCIVIEKNWTKKLKLQHNFLTESISSVLLRRRCNIFSQQSVSFKNLILSFLGQQLTLKLNTYQVYTESFVRLACIIGIIFSHAQCFFLLLCINYSVMCFLQVLVRTIFIFVISAAIS